MRCRRERIYYSIYISYNTGETFVKGKRDFFERMFNEEKAEDYLK